jgi:hypothetical protein
MADTDAYACIAVLAFGLVFVAAAAIATIQVLAHENRKLRKQIAPFDRDGDGRIGGSRKRT